MNRKAVDRVLGNLISISDAARHHGCSIRTMQDRLEKLHQARPATVLLARRLSCGWVLHRSELDRLGKPPQGRPRKGSNETS